MNRRFFAAVAAFVSLVPMIALAAPAGADGELPEWTVMVYMDGDNDIEDFALADLAEMTASGSSEDVNMVVLLDTLTDTADLMYLADGSATTVQEWGEVAMDDGRTLSRFIGTVEELYPAQRTALVLWDHGGGILGVCWDDTSGVDETIRLPELDEALDQADAHFDLMVFNAYLMGQAEIAYQSADHADVLVFSEEVMSGRGFKWDSALDGLRSDPGMDGTALGIMLASNYAANNQDSMGSLFTISVCRSAGVLAVADAMAAAAAAQTEAMDEYANALRECRNRAEEAEAYGPVDIIEYMSNVAADRNIDDEGVRSTANRVVEAVDHAILFHWHLQWVEGMNGLGVYFPRNNTQDEWNVVGDVYSGLSFCGYTGWDEFLAAFYSA